MLLYVDIIAVEGRMFGGESFDGRKKAESE